MKDDVAGVVGIINTAWKYCQNDALDIKRWLEAGKGDADIPPYMALQLGKADGICMYPPSRAPGVWNNAADSSTPIRFHRWEVPPKVRGLLGRYSVVARKVVWILGRSMGWGRDLAGTGGAGDGLSQSRLIWILYAV